MAFVGRPPVPSALRGALLLDFPLHSSCDAVPYGPGPACTALWECWTRPAERGERWTDPREREFPIGKGLAGRCRRHRPGTSPGGWHDARRQMTGVQICTPCCLRRPAPQGVQHQPAEGRFPGSWSRRRGNPPPRTGSGPSLASHAAPRAFRGATPRANQGHRGDNGIPYPGESG